MSSQHVAHGSSSSVVSTHLSRLPLEMLAEILSYTSSPDILSLALTSRFFCATLVTNPASLFIWKAARRRFDPKPIPDPTPNWTKSAYITFFFDTAACEVCHRPTQRLPVSIALRARLCDTWNCYKRWILGLTRIAPDPSALQADFADVAAVQSWLPCFELLFIDSTPGTNVKSGDSLFRPAEWEAAIQRHRESVRNSITYSQIQQVYAKKALIKSDIMRHAKKLRYWVRFVEQHWNDVTSIPGFSENQLEADPHLPN